MCVNSELVFFFFQAEDGIRDLTVTGVQTCALPISLSVRAVVSLAAPADLARGCGFAWAASGAAAHSAARTSASLTLIAGPGDGLRGRALLGRGRRGCGLDERADDELGLEQRPQRVVEHLLRLLLRRMEDHVLRHDNARQAGDVRQELAELVVMAQDLQAVAVGDRKSTRVDREWLEP